MSLHLFNTLSRKIEPFLPLREGEASIYTCGPTVYNFAHIGNLRAYLAADVFCRWLRVGHGLNVKWVMNVTDIEDKIIRDSQGKYPADDPKTALKKFTSEYEDKFFEDLDALGIAKSDFFAVPRATEFISEMQELIRRIAERGFAYEINGSVFFDVRKWSETNTYGKLLTLDLNQLKTGTRTLADEIEKEDLADFALWKARKPGEPYWDFELDGKSLPGRPGWHLECSAMEEALFGLPFDVHTGGVDLIFPHHEDEIAQSACGYGLEPTHYFLHNEHLRVDGKKMSKSLGNFYTLRDLLAKGFTADAIRFFLVTNHYRAKVNLTFDSIEAAGNALEKLRNFTRSATVGEHGEACPTERTAAFVKAAKLDFARAMDDDLNTPVAIAAVHELAHACNRLLPLSKFESESVISFFRFAGKVLGVDFLPPEAAVPDEVRKLAQERQAARERKDWAESDRLRDEIAAFGYTVRDLDGNFEILPLPSSASERL